MSPSDTAVPPKVNFDVTAADSGTEIFLIDGNFNLAGKIIGKGSFSVAPALYKLKVRSGNTTVEKIITVSEGMKPIVLEPVKFTSPVPLADGTCDVHPTAKGHHVLARAVLRAVHHGQYHR